jgi:hypothetical protein
MLHLLNLKVITFEVALENSNTEKLESIQCLSVQSCLQDDRYTSNDISAGEVAIVFVPESICVQGKRSGEGNITYRS